MYQPLATIDVPQVTNLVKLLDGSCAVPRLASSTSLTPFPPSEARENPEMLREEFPPMNDKRVPVGDIFTSCNWVMRDGCAAPFHEFQALGRNLTYLRF